MVRSDHVDSLPEDDRPVIIVDGDRLVVHGTWGRCLPSSHVATGAYWVSAGRRDRLEFASELAVVDASGSSSSVISEAVISAVPGRDETVFDAVLPATAPAFYRISTTVRHHCGAWRVQRFLSVPEQVLDAEIVPAADAWRSPGEFVFEIVNHGSTTLTFGPIYDLERQTEDGWVNCNVEELWELLGSSVDGWSRREQIALLPADAPAGVYRISKEVRAAGTPLQDILILDFEIGP